MKYSPLFLLVFCITCLVTTNVLAQIGPEQVISKPVFTNPDIMHVADLDGDGNQDVIAANNGTLVWWTNTGNNEFENLDTISNGEVLRVSSIHAVDVDGDLDLDVLCTFNEESFCGWGVDVEQTGFSIPPLPPPTYKGYLVLFENLGNGQFGAAQYLDSEVPRAESVFSADLDGDSDIDVLLGCSMDYCGNDSTGLAAWYENDGSGQFGPRQLLSSVGDSISVFSIRAVDFDNDLDIDVVATYNKDKKVIWYENLGAGVFSLQQPLDSILAYNVFELEVADMNGDQKTDLILGKYEEVFWLQNNGGTFSTPAQIITTEVDNLKSIWVADLDDDNDIDVMSASSFDTKVAWYENMGNGTFGNQNIVDSVVPSAAQVLSIDANADNQLEILSLSLNDQEIVWYKNVGNNQFDDERIITPEVNQPYSVFAVDMDADNDNDVLVASYADRKIQLYENLGTGNFGSPIVISKSVWGAVSVYAADLNQDNKPDIISAARNGDELAWYENLGNNVYGQKQVVSDTINGIRSVVAGDVDGDNLKDLVAACGSCDKVVWFKNLGAGTFGSEQVLSSSVNFPMTVYISDLDGDLDMDILASVFYSPNVIWFENLGGGIFATEQVIGAGLSSVRVAIAADIDQDGDQDVLSGGDGSLNWFENTGGGNFNAPVALSSMNPVDLFASDISNDGQLDVLFGSGGQPSVGLAVNDGQVVFSTTVSVSDNNSVRSIFAADIDGDGDDDVLSASSGDHKVSWFENLYLVTSIDEETQVEIELYPNPTTGVCIVKLSEPSQLQVFNAIGELVLTKKCNVLAQVHLEDQPDGIYFLRFETSKGLINKKVVKMK